MQIFRNHMPSQPVQTAPHIHIYKDNENKQPGLNWYSHLSWIYISITIAPRYAVSTMNPAYLVKGYG